MHFLYFFLISSHALQLDSNLCFRATIAHTLGRRLPLPHSFSSAVLLLLLPALQHCLRGIIPCLPLHLCMLLTIMRAFQCQLPQTISPCQWHCIAVLPWSGDILKQGDVSVLALPSSHHTFLWLMLLCFQHSEQ